MPGKRTDASAGSSTLGLSAGFALLYAALAVAAVLIARDNPSSIATLPSLILALTLIALSVIDQRAYRLPDALTLPLLGAGLVRVGLFDPPSLLVHAMAAVLGWALLAGVAAVYIRTRGREGLGQGDAKLLAAAGAWLGPEGLLSTMLIGSVSALLVVLAGSLSGRSVTAGTKIAFGPFLAIGTWLTWLYGPLI